MVKKGEGRKKIAMKKIENENHLLVTFSKRRDGLFKKACELGILCGANASFIVFSPSNKVYSFGNPSVDMVLHQYLTNNDVDINITNSMVGSSQNSTPQDFYTKINNAENNLSIQKAIGKQINDLKKAKEDSYWWDGLTKDKFTREKIDLLKGMMEKVSQDIQIAKHIRFEANNVEAPIVDASTFAGPYDGTRCPHSQNIASFDPMIPDQSSGFVIPYGYILDNEFDLEIPNSFTNNLPLIGGSHPSLETGTREINPAIPFDPSANDCVGPSGTKTWNASTHGYNRGCQ